MHKKRKNDRTGIYVTGRIADGLAGLIFREQLPGVTGLDAHFEILKNSYKFSRVIGVKILTASSSEGDFICRGSVENLVYWFQHSIPILIMVYDPENQKVFWEHLREDNIELTSTEWELRVPLSHEFCEDALDSILKIPSYSPHLSRLAVDRPWMEIADSTDYRLILTAEENINRSAGRGILQISITAPNGEKQDIYDWVFSADPDVPFVYRFQELFPWAEICVDRVFYQLNAPYEDSLCGIRPWIVEAGEVAHFRLEMKLNGLGKSFLLAERFLTKGDYPNSELEGGFGSLYEDGIKFRAVNSVKRSPNIFGD